VSFLLIDIDWFKMINDNYGHDFGDKILVQLGKEINCVARETDIFSRWGEEEFLLILYNSDASNKLIFCQRLHLRIKNSIA
jgi:diguanylate cyclase (GGDEF)-like protein